MKVLVRVYVREGGKVRGNVCGQGGGRGFRPRVSNSARKPIRF